MISFTTLLIGLFIFILLSFVQQFPTNNQSFQEIQSKNTKTTTTTTTIVTTKPTTRVVGTSTVLVVEAYTTTTTVRSRCNIMVHSRSGGHIHSIQQRQSAGNHFFTPQQEQQQDGRQQLPTRITHHHNSNKKQQGIVMMMKSIDENDSNMNDLNNNNNDVNNSINVFGINVTEPLFLFVWIVLIVWTIGLAPGQINTPNDDTILLESFMNTPTTLPLGWNEIFALVFNLFTPMSILLAMLIVPNSSSTTSINSSTSSTSLLSYNKNDDDDNSSSSIGSDSDKNRLMVSSLLTSSVPYVIGASFFGFFVIAPYLAIRQGPTTIQQQQQQQRSSSRSWLTQNILENKIVSWFVIAFILYLPFNDATNLIHSIQNKGLDNILYEYIEMFKSSKLISVSLIDLTLLYITTTFYMIPIDYQLRTTATASTDNNDNVVLYEKKKNQRQGIAIAIAAGLVPILGTAIYCAIRPPLPQHFTQK